MSLSVTSGVHSAAIRSRSRRIAVLGARTWPVSLVLVVAFASPALGQSSPRIVRVEEDWRIEVGVPDPDTDSPQIITVISPTGSISGFHVMFELNHMTQPDYFSGGMQLQCWHNDVPSCYHSYPAWSKLSRANEVITYTTRMDLDHGHLEVSIRNGSSQTWGTFGNDWRLQTCEDTTLWSLNGYSPTLSVSHSRVAFASHQVQRLSLVRVRYYTEDGLLSTDNTERVVHQHSAN